MILEKDNEETPDNNNFAYTFNHRQIQITERNSLFGQKKIVKKEVGD